jgi:hypothetical protein
MSEPQRLTPDMPMLSACLTAELRPSNPNVVTGSPPHTSCAQRAAPVHPERWKRTMRLPPRIEATPQW